MRRLWAVFGFCVSFSLLVSCAPAREPDAAATPAGTSQPVATLEAPIASPQWTAKVSAAVNASPILSGDLVLIPAADGSIHALQAADGQPKWIYRESKVWDASVNADQEKVCAGAEGGQVLCLEAETGSLLWSTILELEVQSRLALTPEWVYAPTTRVGAGLANDFTGGAFLAALDAKTGQVVWQGVTENYILRRPVVHDDLVITGGAYQPADKPDGEVETRLYAFSLEDGSLVWEHSSDNGLMRWVEASEDLVLFSAASETVYALRVEDGSLVWKYGPGYWMQFPAFAQGGMFFGSGAELFHAVDVASGGDQWSYALDTASLNQVGRPIVRENQVWFNSVIGEIFALDLETGEQLAYFRTGQSVRVGGTMYQSLYILGDADGSIHAYQMD